MAATTPTSPARGFQALTTPAQWQDLLNHGTRRPVDAGTLLLDQGGPSRLVYAFEQGRARVVYTEDNGDEVLVAVRGPGDLLGEYAQRDRSEHMASVRALEDCTAVVLTSDAFEGCVRRNQLGDALQRYILDKTRQTAKRMWRASNLKNEQRMAQLFLEVIAADPGRDEASVPMTQDDLASSLGVSLSSVAHLLAKWRKLGLIRTRPSKTIVLDVAALSRRATSR